MNALLRAVANVGRVTRGAAPITEEQARTAVDAEAERAADWALWHADPEYAKTLGIDKTKEVEEAMEHIRERAISANHARKLAAKLMYLHMGGE
jgi:hypothetical protein